MKKWISFIDHVLAQTQAGVKMQNALKWLHELILFFCTVFKKERKRQMYSFIFTEQMEG